MGVKAATFWTCATFSVLSVSLANQQGATTSQTLIDVLLTNNKRRCLTSGTLEPHISDHRLIYTVMRISHRHWKSLIVTARSYKSYYKEKFLSDLAAVPFHVPFIFDDVDDQVWAFEKLFNEIANDHTPIKRFRIRDSRMEAIRLRNRLWQKYLKQRTETLWLDYKKQRNVCTSLRRKAIAGYFHNKANVSEAKPQESSLVTFCSYLQIKM